MWSWAGRIKPEGSKREEGPECIPASGSAHWEGAATRRNAEESDFFTSVLSPVSDHWWDVAMAEGWPISEDSVESKKINGLKVPKFQLATILRHSKYAEIIPWNLAGTILSLADSTWQEIWARLWLSHDFSVNIIIIITIIITFAQGRYSRVTIYVHFCESNSTISFSWNENTVNIQHMSPLWYSPHSCTYFKEL